MPTEVPLLPLAARHSPPTQEQGGCRWWGARSIRTTEHMHAGGVPSNPVQVLPLISVSCEESGGAPGFPVLVAVIGQHEYLRAQYQPPVPAVIPMAGSALGTVVVYCSVWCLHYVLVRHSVQDVLGSVLFHRMDSSAGTLLQHVNKQYKYMHSQAYAEEVLGKVQVHRAKSGEPLVRPRVQVVAFAFKLEEF